MVYYYRLLLYLPYSTMYTYPCLGLNSLNVEDQNTHNLKFTANEITQWLANEIIQHCPLKSAYYEYKQSVNSVMIFTSDTNTKTQARKSE